MASPRLGWLLFDPEQGRLPLVAATLDVPIEVVETWKQRDQQIFLAEAFAPLAATLDTSLMDGRDVIWFVETDAACSTLIRGASTQEDVQAIAEASHFVWAIRRMRVWVEWIDTHSNPSDGLSCDGLADEWCSTRGISPRLAQAPPWTSPHTMVGALCSQLPSIG